MVLFYDFGEIFYCEYQAPQKTKQLFIEYGFYYTNVSLENLQTIQWSNIHWEKLKQYLKMLSTQKQFSYIETLLKVDFSKIQKWDLDTLQMFYNYIKNLHLEDPKWAQKRQKSLEKLKKLLPRSIKEN